MSLATILDKRQKRAALTAKAGGILTAAKKAGRAPTKAELDKFNRMHADVEALGTEVRSLEAARKQANAVDQLQAKPEAVAAAGRQDRILRAFCLGDPTYLRGAADVQAAKRARLYPNGGGKQEAPPLRLSAQRPPTLLEARSRQAASLEQRSMSRLSGAAGDYAVPEGFTSTVDVALLSFGGMREAAQVIRTAAGGDLPFPTVDDTSNAGAIVAEDVADTEQDVAMGQLVLGAFTYTSKLVRVSMELLQDEAVNVQELLGRLLGERIARILNTHFTTGSGVAQPKGAVTCSVLGKTAAAAAAVTRNELVQLKHSVDPAYRGPGARFMFKDSTLSAIKQLVDGDGRPLWQAGIGEGEPDRIDGDPYVVNQDMPAMTAGLKSILYGDFSKYLIRDVLDMQLLVLRERYAEYRQLAFLAFSRHDGDLLDAGTNPIKHLIQA